MGRLGESLVVVTTSAMATCLVVVAGYVAAGAIRQSSDATVDSGSAGPTTAPRNPTSSIRTTDQPADDEPAATTSASAGTAVEEPTTVTEPDVTTSQVEFEFSREAELYAGFATIRQRPEVSFEEGKREIRGQSGKRIIVHGAIQDGWYEVEVPDAQGWLFGAFVLPPDPGFSVGITRDERPAVLRDSGGAVLGTDNLSGNKVLIVGRSGDLFEILTPDYRVAYVLEGDIQLVGVG